MSLKGFSLGVIIGATISGVVTYLYSKNMYESIINDEIAELKEHYKKHMNHMEVDDSEVISVPVEQQELDIKEYRKMVEEEMYGDKNIRPITEYEFASDEDYEKIGIIRYQDNIFTYDDGSNEPIDNIKSVLGDNYESNLPEDDDSTYFRDEKLKNDYEILYDERRHTDIV